MVIALAAPAYGSDSSRGSLAGRFTAGQQRASRLQQAIQADSKLIRGYEGRIGNLQARLNVVERSVAAQERLLNAVNVQLNAARERLRSLEAQYARGRRLLAAQLVADYESPQPTVVDVALDARGFDDLINRLSALRSIARTNAHTIRVIKATQLAVAAQTRRLAQIQARRKRATAAVLVERDQIAQLKLALVSRD